MENRCNIEHTYCCDDSQGSGVGHAKRNTPVVSRPAYNGGYHSARGVVA